MNLRRQQPAPASTCTAVIYETRIAELIDEAGHYQSVAAEKVRLEAAQVEKARIEAAEQLGEAFYNQFRDNFLCGSPEVLLGQHGLVGEGLMDADGIVVVLTPAQAYVLACILAAY